MIAFKSNLVASVLLVSLAFGHLRHAICQEFLLEVKGKKSPPTVCSAALVSFDGSTVKIGQSPDAASYKASGIAACTQTSLSPSELDITIALAGAPDPGPAPFDPNKMFPVAYNFGGYQNEAASPIAVLDTRSVANSTPTRTKDVMLQKAEIDKEAADRKQAVSTSTWGQGSVPAEQPDVFVGKIAAIVDLTRCKGRCGDWIITLVGGSKNRISGKISSISGGWIWLQQPDNRVLQRFSLSMVSMIGLGACQQ
jgi:hypothetical protein